MYLIYAKLPGAKRFYPLGGGSVVKNKIYAEMWLDKVVAEKCLASLIATHPDIEFEIRENN